ncbi:NAD-dependent DNA ligase LigA [Taibaiella lutea]|uniref:DNA ligase n=1 Tax=Taibaiella lutea TaxID=2608001 RepID=A0A5M6CQT7_9BACT|nr:NAD-dependent DNA ligase LigA [Taibaiella lutea]KAA5537326.1 NAD-dependent DNA ligase LigA [Taibaiella lutea]
MYQPEDEQRLSLWAKELLKSSNEDVQTQLDMLRSVINYNDWKYYVQDNSVLADVEYDTLFKQLKELENAHPDLITADSPTQRIAKGLSEQFTSVSHLVPMLSLENSYNAEDLREWDKRCRETSKESEIEYTVEPKYDGAGISLYYEDDKLVRGATRGDGIMGEDITPNVKQIKSIPLSAALSKQHIQSLEIRGEVIIPKDTFKNYNEQRIAEGLAPLANPRNAASGTLRMLDPREVAKRGLSAILYHVSYHTTENNVADPEVMQTHYGTLEWLYNIGFNSPVKNMKRCKTIDEVIDYVLDFEQHRDDLPFEIDGMVIKVNSLELQDRLGQTTHHPRWAIAYKFKARQASSKLLRVEFQVGRTGSITPVAKIEPVPIGGVTVGSISLFNEEVIKEKDLKIGDTVLVERAGDVIPYIVKSNPELRNGTEEEIIFPTHCPVCKEELFKPEGEAAWRCINVSCEAQVVERLIHFASKDAMDIRSFGDSNIRRFHDMGIVKDIAGIYKIDYEQLNGLEKFGAKSVENLKVAIEKSKQQPLNRLIFGLGIRYVGETTAKTLANAVNHLKDFQTWTVEQLCTLEDIGPKVAGSVYQFFQAHENIHILDELEVLGLTLTNQHKKDGNQENGALSGKTFLFTGTLSRFKRSDAEALVEERGGKLLSGVSSKLNYLIVGADAGSKLEKAKKLGTVKVLTEDEFGDLLEE